MSPPLQLCPLGGCGEFGLNATLLQLPGAALLIDCGAQLGAGGPGVERRLPELSALDAPDLGLQAVLLTHGHEDHIGAMPQLLKAHPVPVYGSRYTLMMLRARLEGQGVAKPALHELAPGATARIGPFEVEAVQVSHSIPEAVAFSVLTPAGRVVHSGDFRLDPTAAEPTDHARLRALGEAGVEVLLSDSTNAERPPDAAEPPEAEVHRALAAQLSAAPGRTVVSLVSSHVHRIAALARAAQAEGKQLSLLGGALERSWARGVQAGLLPSDPGLRVAPESLGRYPRDRVLLLATGAQGEWQGGLHRISQARPGSALAARPGDQLLISARLIPGHERAVRALHNRLIGQGVRVVTDRMAPIHCSGHASPRDQAALIRWLRPRHFIPIHGDRAMLEAHAALARGLRPAPQVHLLTNGQTAALEGGQLHRVDPQAHGSAAFDRYGQPLSPRHLRDRDQLSREGLVALSLLRGPRGELEAPPQLQLFGLAHPPGLQAELQVTLTKAFAAQERRPQLDQDALKRRLQPVIRRHTGARPRLLLLLHQR